VAESRRTKWMMKTMKRWWWATDQSCNLINHWEKVKELNNNKRLWIRNWVMINKVSLETKWWELEAGQVGTKTSNSNCLILSIVLAIEVIIKTSKSIVQENSWLNLNTVLINEMNFRNNSSRVQVEEDMMKMRSLDLNQQTLKKEWAISLIDQEVEELGKLIALCNSL
jgi:hypothetical protein